MKRTNSEPSTATHTAPICWQREPNSPCLRIELANGDLHIFPYSHLITASLAHSENDTETLRISFSTHEVEITGHALRDLVLGIQDFAIKWLRTLPERYQVAPVREGMITSIQIHDSASS